MGGASAVAGICFLALGAPGFHVLLRGPLWLYVLPLSTIPGVLVIAYWWAILRGINRIFLLNVVEVAGKGVSLVFLLTLVWWLRLGVAGAVWTDLLTNVGMVVLMVVLLGHMGILGRPSFDRSVWRRTRRFALPAYCSSVLSYLNYRVDQFIIAALLPPEQLGFYIIAVSLAERLWVLTGAVANVLLPHLTNTHERDPELVAVIARHVVVWTGMACLLVFALADIVVRVMYSSAFVEVVTPLRWLLPGILTAAIGKVLVAEILAREKIHYTTWTAVVIAPANIVANLVLIPHMGISGAALSSSISYSLLSLMMIWFYLRETRVPWSVLIPRLSDLQVYTALWRRPTDVASRL
jgi:O-antigen/teichoic acid export membrane protein